LAGDPELRYEKSEIIGKGSFGIVYRGYVSVDKFGVEFEITPILLRSTASLGILAPC
jgi:hypothetical protein